jgi:hypothetical protein
MRVISTRRLRRRSASVSGFATTGALAPAAATSKLPQVSLQSALHAPSTVAADTLRITRLAHLARKIAIGVTYKLQCNYWDVARPIALLDGDCDSRDLRPVTGGDQWAIAGETIDDMRTGVKVLDHQCAARHRPSNWHDRTHAQSVSDRCHSAVT